MAKITYTTATLAAAIMGDEAIETPAARKANTRTLRKFLRDELGEGKAVVGKGARYALEYGAPELRAMKKKFAAWEIKQQEMAEARKAALAAAKGAKPAIEAETDTAPIADDADNDDTALEGPTDAEIAAMLSDDDESDDDA